MTIRKLQSGPFADRARRSVREIGLALVLTLAAVVFVFAATRNTTPDTASLPTPGGFVEAQPQTNPESHPH